ncbi:MAG: Dephospho-CoA kinase [Desulfotomaculum sp. 46_296]|nr:MAG: Dephospho-CoA kinase [Desulfotomaculum sp. 46_296]HAU32141.1 dephospho-CoA kinase [Desulfotomaculum sp.]
MVIAALTGSIASGKSTVAGFFKELGAYIIDFDALGHELMKPGQKVWRKIVDYFGDGILNEDQTIDRIKLASIVFDASWELGRLNEMIHPEILKESERITEEILLNDPGAIIIKDVPLLSESFAKKMAKYVIVAWSSEDSQIKRLSERGLDEFEARKRIQAQAPLNEKLKFADFVIYTDLTIEDTIEQVAQVFKILRNLT